MHEIKKEERNHSKTTFKFLGKIIITNYCCPRQMSKALEVERKIRLGHKIQQKKKFINMQIPENIKSILFDNGELLDNTPRTMTNDKYKFLITR